MINYSDVEPMPEAEPDAGFWSQTEILAHILAFARYRGAAPYATLGTVLRRVVGCIEPSVVLPPTVGGEASLNLFTVPVGASGSGKDIANAAGRAAVDFFQWVGNSPVPAQDATYIHPGTGEGLARAFKGYKDEPGDTRAHLQVPDVATLEALAGRSGHTLVGQILAAWMGQPLGFTNNAKDTSTGIKEHTYRLCMSVGVQPENAGFFLSREKDGLPQRFLWLPTIDPYAPEVRPAPVEPLTINLPTFKLDKNGRHVMAIPDGVAEEIWHFRWLVRTGAEGIDPLDGHLKLTQLKTAAAIAILHGSTEVTDDAWKIASQLIDVSTQVREGLRAAVADKSRRENTARAHDQADREAIIRARLSEDAQRRVAQAITRKLERSKSATRRELRLACTLAIRDEFDAVFDLFLDKEFIVSCEGVEGHAQQYRLG
jgi:hypothetical protein